MKIIIPILGFGRAGGNRVLSQFANQWIQQGHKVDFLCPNSSAEPYFPTNAGILWVDGAGKISNKRDTTAKSSGWYHLKAQYRGLKVIGSKYDVILANHSLTAWPVALASCDIAKKIYYVQAYEPEYYTSAKTVKGFLLATVSALSYHLPLKRIVNAPLYLHYKNLRAKQFVPPGLDLDIFKPALINRKIEDAKSIVIGCIGRHEPEKGTIFVLQAFEALYKRDSRFVLRVAYGNLPGDWKHEQCEVVAPKNDHELADYYRSLDILVAPGTAQHGAPHYPVLEAGACGVAVVTTGYMGATPKNAWIVRNKDVEAIVESILDIVSNDNQRIEKTANFLNATKDYTWEYVSRKILNLF
jgi:glycosyltransferase involved in cell wall biosynthesis